MLFFSWGLGRSSLLLSCLKVFTFLSELSLQGLYWGLFFIASFSLIQNRWVCRNTVASIFTALKAFGCIPVFFPPLLFSVSVNNLPTLFTSSQHPTPGFLVYQEINMWATPEQSGGWRFWNQPGSLSKNLEGGQAESGEVEKGESRTVPITGCCPADSIRTAEEQRS